MSRVALDLFCGGGGAARGLISGGFDVVGVDRYASPAYPGPVLVGDVADLRPRDLAGFDLVWASPPCQRYSVATGKKYQDSHPDMLAAVQDLLDQIETPSIVENVVGAPMRRPAGGLIVTISGPQVGLHLIERKRLFACRGFWPMVPPRAPLRRFGPAVGCFKDGPGVTVRDVPGAHAKRNRRAGAITVLVNGPREWGENANGVASAAIGVTTHGSTITAKHTTGEKKNFQAAVGALPHGESWLVDRRLHGEGVLRGKALARACLGIEDDAMTQRELGEAIPPAYAELLARQVG